MKCRLPAVVAALIAFLSVAPATAQNWTPLITPEQLVGLSGKVDLIDIRQVNGGAGYAVGHIDGAISAPYPLWRGPPENPGQRLSDRELSMLLRSKGLTKNKPVVISYLGANPTDFGAAARVYWTLKSAGIQRIAILDGGIYNWLDERLPLSTEPVTPQPSGIRAKFSTQWLATREEVKAISGGQAAGTLVDARPDAFLSGKKKHPRAEQAGTISGAEQFVFTQWFDGQKAIVGGGLLARFRKPEGEGPVVSFCNTGHWASTNWFMMSEVQRIEGVKLYPESMVGWTRAGEAVVTQQ